MAEQQGASPVIIKRVKKAAHGSHGGAWKIAYADFVTAMMAFFLLLWLLNSVTQEQLQGISNFFAPITTSKSQTGAGAILGGKTISDPGAGEASTARATVTMDLPPPKAGSGPQDDSSKPSEEAAKEALKEKEDEQFKKAESELKKAIEGVPAFRQLANSLLVDNTPEGLRIQIVDQDGLAMFPAGSSEPYLHTRRLLEVVGGIVKEMPQKVSIAGHTDSTGFKDQTQYSNWELSSDRANAARRFLMRYGVPAERVARVEGKAFVDPLIADDPANPRNRRLTIVLLRGSAEPKPSAGAKPTQEELPGLNQIRDRQRREGATPPAGAPAAPAAPPAPAAPVPQGGGASLALPPPRPR